MGEQWKLWETLFWGGSEITAGGDFSHEIKRPLLLGRKVLTNLDSIKKQRHYFLTKVRLVKALVFSVVMYRYKSWTIKAARQRIDAFELWCWRRLLRVPWTERRSNQSILKERKSVLSIHWRDWWWSWSSNTLATWYKELTHPDAEKDWRQEGKGK